MFKWINKQLKGVTPLTTNEEWLKALRPPPDENAIQQLRVSMVHGLSSVIWNRLDKDRDEFVKDVVQDAILKVLDNIDTFRGESKFTTWAVKIAVREAYTELRRKKYQDISLGDIVTDNIGGSEPDPDRLLHESMIVQKVLRIIDEELSEKQKKVINALMIEGLPVSVVSEMMYTNRNAVYKLVHDARLNIKNRLSAEGIDPETVLNDL